MVRSPFSRAESVTFSALCALSLLPACSSVPGTADANEPTSHVSSAILGGQPDLEHTAVMALTHPIGPNEFALCSASVLEARERGAILLTAAHCVAKWDDAGEVLTPVQLVDPKTIVATPGVYQQEDAVLGRSFRAVQVFVPPAYDGFNGSPDDIALVRVVGATADLPHFSVLTPEQDQQLRVLDPVTLVGYGQTEQPEDSGKRRTTPQQLAWLNEQFLGLDQTNGHGICEGDSGGPVLVPVGDTLAIAGVNSIAVGTKDAPCSKGATSTRIARFADFIAQAVASIPSSLDCASCVSAEQAPGNACAPDGAACQGPCADFVSCMDACTDETCLTACYGSQTTGSGQYYQRLAAAPGCAKDRCADTCSAEPPPSDGGSPATPDSAAHDSGCSCAVPRSASHPANSLLFAVFGGLGLLLARRARRVA